MQEFWFYIELGLRHVLDISAYDHILFLAAMALPFTFKVWKQVVLLATMFTLAHCLSLYLSVYKIISMNVGLIEFLIPVTILGTALFNLGYVRSLSVNKTIFPHIFATFFFGLIHGFGFSNYFNMLLADENEKLVPLLGFATGIEMAQVSLVLIVLLLVYLFLDVLRIKQVPIVVSASILIIVITIPMLVDTFPW